MDTPEETCMDNVGPMAPRDDKVDITIILPVTLIVGIEFSTTLDETLGLDIVGG